MDTATAPGAPSTGPRRSRLRTGLLTLQVITSSTALAGGALLVWAPDGSLLAADPAVLRGTPFQDWRIPGLLLGLLVGGGFALSAVAVRSRSRWARPLSVVAGLGLVLFESVELVWLGFQPLQLVFAVVGVAVAIGGSQQDSAG